MSNHSHMPSEVVGISEGRSSEHHRKMFYQGGGAHGSPDEEGNARSQERDFSPGQARAIILEGRYNSLDEARKHLRELIHKNRSVL